MADHCIFCNTRRPDGGTNMLVIGEKWLEFCKPCGDEQLLRHEVTGEEKTIREVFDMGSISEETIIN